MDRSSKATTSRQVSRSGPTSKRPCADLRHTLEIVPIEPELLDACDAPIRPHRRARGRCRTRRGRLGTTAARALTIAEQFVMDPHGIDDDCAIACSTTARSPSSRPRPGSRAVRRTGPDGGSLDGDRRRGTSEVARHRSLPTSQPNPDAAAAFWRLYGIMWSHGPVSTSPPRRSLASATPARPAEYCKACASTVPATGAHRGPRRPHRRRVRVERPRRPRQGRDLLRRHDAARPAWPHARPAEPPGELDEGQLLELTLGIGLFHGFSKIVVALGPPPDMPTMVVPTPDWPQPSKVRRRSSGALPSRRRQISLSGRASSCNRVGGGVGRRQDRLTRAPRQAVPLRPVALGGRHRGRARRHRHAGTRRGKRSQSRSSSPEPSRVRGRLLLARRGAAARTPRWRPGAHRAGSVAAGH